MKAMVPKGPSMNEMLRQAQKMQEDMQKKQAELEEKEYEVSAGGGVVKVKMNGRREVLSVKGAGLSCASYNKSSLGIEGMISSISFERMGSYAH